MLKREITATLDFLPSDSLKLLAEFATFLRVKRTHNGVYVEDTQAQRQIPAGTHPKRLRVASPRLAHREQAIDFQMEVIVEPADASL